MSNWIALTSEDLDDTKVAALMNALRSSALGATQDDPWEEIIATVVARIRAEVGQCERNTVDSDSAKIPASLKRLACRMAIFEMMGRLQMALSDDERDERRSDERLLVRISKCELAVEQPDTATAPEVQRTGGIEIVSTTPTARRATRASLRGL